MRGQMRERVGWLRQTCTATGLRQGIEQCWIALTLAVFRRVGDNHPSGFLHDDPTTLQASELYQVGSLDRAGDAAVILAWCDLTKCDLLRKTVRPDQRCMHFEAIL